MSDQLPPFILVVQTGPQACQTFMVEEGINSIGRDPANKVVLADRSVSQNHAHIVRSVEGVWIEDLGSTTGTFVNGQQLTESVWLQPGDVVHIGPTVALALQLGQPAAHVSRPQQQIGRWVVAIGAALLIALVLAIVGWWFFWTKPVIAGPPGPTIFVREPAPDTYARFNSPLFFYAIAHDERRVSRGELWVDGQVVLVKNSDLPEGLNPFTFAASWVPLTTGKRDFFVRATSTDGRPGQSSVVGLHVLQVRSERDHPVYVIQRGDSLRSVAERGNASAEQIITLNPIIEEVAEALDVPPEELELPPGEELVLPWPESQPGGEEPALPPAEAQSGGEASLPRASNDVPTGSVPPGPPPPVPAPPESPIGGRLSPPSLTVAQASGCDVGLSWMPVESSAAYRIYRYEASNPGHGTPIIVGGNQTTWADTVPRNGTWMYAVAALDRSDRERLGEEKALVVTGCNVAPSPGSLLHLEVIDFRPSTGSSPDDIYCYIVHNVENSLVTIPLREAQPQAMPPGQPLGTITWQLSNPLYLYFSCFDRSFAPPQYLGYVKDRVEFDDEAWQKGYLIRPAFTTGPATAQGYFLLNYRLCLGPCRPLDEIEAEEVDGRSELPPPSPPRADPDLPAPSDLRWARSSFACARQAWDSIGFNICRGFPFHGYRVLTWDWSPAYADQELWSFEVWQRIYRQSYDLALIGRAEVVDIAGSRVAGNTGALVPEIQGKLGCNQVAEVYVQAVGPNGRSEKSAPLKLASAPPCQAEVTVTFDTLRASDVDDGWWSWFGLGFNDDMETTGWVSVNYRYGQLTGEREIEEGKTYRWDRLGLDRGPTFREVLGEGETLSIEAQLFDDDEGIWCNDFLELPARSATEWAQFNSHTQALDHRKTYDAAKCDVQVSITGEVIP
jgi:hypothetical protein